MDDETPSTATQPATRHEPAGANPQAAVDVERLADKVYHLMLADVRLSQARGERLPVRWKG